MKIPWKYCECGCHGFGATIGGVQLSHSPRFGKEVLFVSVPPEESQHADMDEAEKAAETRLRLLLVERRAQVEELERLFGETSS